MERRGAIGLIGGLAMVAVGAAALAPPNDQDTAYHREQYDLTFK